MGRCLGGILGRVSAIRRASVGSLSLRVCNPISCGINAPHCSNPGEKTCAIQNPVNRSNSNRVASGSLVKKLRIRRASGTCSHEGIFVAFPSLVSSVSIVGLARGSLCLFPNLVPTASALLVSTMGRAMIVAIVASYWYQKRSLVGVIFRFVDNVVLDQDLGAIVCLSFMV